MPFSIDDIHKLYIRAEGNYLYLDEENEERKHLEAFLVQTALIEGVLAKIALEALKQKKFEKLAQKRKEQRNYGLNDVINDLYLLKVIENNEFEKLHKYKNTRNNFIHKLLEKEIGDIDREAEEHYKKGRELLGGMIEKLKKICL